MKHIIKKIIVVFLSVVVLLLSGCVGTPTQSGNSAAERIAQGTLLYPATNQFFRYNIYTTYISISECLTTEKNLVIPDEIEVETSYGKKEVLPVLGIEKMAFANNTFVVNIQLGENINYIREEAFAGCLSLQYINLPESIETIETRAFADCTSLKELSFPSNLLSIESSVCEGCTNMEKATIKETPTQDTAKTIHASAFGGCDNLSYVWLPSEVTTIEDGAFSMNTKKLTMYGYSASAAAEYCATNLINFTVLDLKSFNNIAIITSSFAIPNYSTVEQSISSDRWQISLLDYKICNEIGKYKASNGKAFLIMDFSVTNTSDYQAFFNPLKIKMNASGYSKPITYLGVNQIDGRNLLGGYLNGHQTIIGYIICEINENWIYAYADFSGLEGFEEMSNHETCLAVYNN